MRAWMNLAAAIVAGAALTGCATEDDGPCAGAFNKSAQARLGWSVGLATKANMVEADREADECVRSQAGGGFQPAYPPGTTAIVGEDGKVIITIPATPEKK